MPPDLQNALLNFLTMLLIALVSIATAIISAKLPGFIAALVAKYDASTTEQQRETIAAIVSMAVQAAEQTGLKDALLNQAQAKKQMALTAAQTALDKHGITLSAQDLDNRIEAAVLSNFNWPRVAPVPAPLVTPVAASPSPDASPVPVIPAP